MSNEFKSRMTPSLFNPATERLSYEATLRGEDIRQPWKSVNGFSVSAARLAARQQLVLHCREDEVFELVVKLNNLLKSPDVLDQACERLHYLEQQARQKVAELLTLQQQPLTGQEIDLLLEDLEQFLLKSARPAVANRLQEILAPHHKVSELTGSIKMLLQILVWLAALKRVKNRGFHVTVFDRYRRPERPTLEARRNEPIFHNGRQTTLPAGFLQPAKYHLTLWSYLVVRSGQSQSRIWN